MRLVVPLHDRRGARRIVPVRDESSAATIQAFDWPGVLLEAGHNDVAEVDDLALAHHYFGINADRRPITLEVKEQYGYRPVTLNPGAGWLMPAGQPFSLRVRGAGVHSYVRISIDPLRFDRLVSAADENAVPVTLRRTFGIEDPRIQHLVGALTAEASDATPSGLPFVDALTTALSLQLVRQAGLFAPRFERARRGLEPDVRQRVLEVMHAQPAAHLTIDALAREAGLSPAHFARAFKESVGRAPHQYLLDLRLERARHWLDAPEATLSDVALRAGFADQAHFTRFFKRRYGITPGVMLRSRRRATG
jgi:AraC family transcriptional regulator